MILQVLAYAGNARAAQSGHVLHTVVMRCTEWSCATKWSCAGNARAAQSGHVLAAQMGIASAGHLRYACHALFNTALGLHLHCS